MANSNKIRITINEEAEEPIQLDASLKLPIDKLVRSVEPEQAINRLTMLFNQCSVAHKVVGLAAVEHAVQQPVSDTVQKYRSFLVQLESVHHTLWLVLIDLPKMLDLPPNWDIFKPISQQLLNFINLGVHSPLLKLCKSSQQNECRSEIDLEWFDLIGPLNSVCKETKNRLLSSQFIVEIEAQIHRYDWPTESCETALFEKQIVGPVKRYQHMITQSDKRLISLFQILKADLQTQLDSISHTLEIALKQKSLPTVSSDCDIGKISYSSQCQIAPSANHASPFLYSSVVIETARGALQHEICLRKSDNKGVFVEKWRVTSPTELNFTEESCVKAWLCELVTKFNYSESELLTRMNLLIKLINPCYKVELEYVKKRSVHEGISYA